LIYVGSGNHAPRPVATATPSSGYEPLEVGLSSAGTSDPDGDPLTCRWNFGDGVQASGCDLRHTYAQNGSYVATLFVSDGQVESQATAVVTVGSLPPVATILTPAATATYQTGETISFSGRADDPDEGQLGAQALRWTIIQHHNEHQHDYLDTTGTGGTFVAAAHGGVIGTVSYEIVLTATDSSGLSATRSVTLHENQPPFVGLGNPWVAACAPAGWRVVLDGSASGDPDSQPLTYTWSEISGVPVSLTGNGTPFASFAPPVLAGGAVLTFHLSVSDGHVSRGDDITRRPVLLRLQRSRSVPVVPGAGRGARGRCGSPDDPLVRRSSCRYLRSLPRHDRGPIRVRSLLSRDRDRSAELRRRRRASRGPGLLLRGAGGQRLRPGIARADDPWIEHPGSRVPDRSALGNSAPPAPTCRGRSVS